MSLVVCFFAIGRGMKWEMVGAIISLLVACRSHDFTIHKVFWFSSVRENECARFSST